MSTTPLISQPPYADVLVDASVPQNEPAPHTDRVRRDRAILALVASVALFTLAGLNQAGYLGGTPAIHTWSTQCLAAAGGGALYLAIDQYRPRRRAEEPVALQVHASPL